jgi:hypothetical protein
MVCNSQVGGSEASRPKIIFLFSARSYHQYGSQGGLNAVTRSYEHNGESLMCQQLPMGSIPRDRDTLAIVCDLDFILTDLSLQLEA